MVWTLNAQLNGVDDNDINDDGNDCNDDALWLQKKVVDSMTAFDWAHKKVENKIR